ncbi:MAG TPA: tryptophan synthase subunit alpha, partial [Cytophagales bacterium]|nr:tryptophan synthase subunit alpha [Cytophagales bacterium]
PKLRDTRTILHALEKAGTDIVEIGMPYSDPMADGPTIQQSNDVAIGNGMTIHTLFDQLQGMREHVSLPIVLMGYINPVMQFGLEKFCQKCQEVGIDGLILPDLPMAEYLDIHKPTFEKYGLYNVFLITPQTSEARIREIDENTHGFIYMVSSASITGAKGSITEGQVAYFNRVNAMGLRNPRLIGFGISNHETFSTACQYAKGAIIGSAFINLVRESHDLEKDITEYIHAVKGR